jgi:hypothetical protein
MSLDQPLLLSSALVHQVLLNPTTYPYKQVSLRSDSCQLPRWPTNGRSFQGKTPSLGECLRQTRDTSTEGSLNYYEIWI